MSERIKNYLGIAIIITVLLFAYAAVSYVRSYSRSAEPGSFRSFGVSGQGKAVAVPDVASFTYSIISEGGKDLAALQTANTTKANQTNKFLKELGVAERDLRTTGYNISPRYQTSNCARSYVGLGMSQTCPPPEIVGYSISQSVEVKIRDFAKIGQALAGVVDNGANSASALNFTLDDPTEPENEARAEAIAKAQIKAEAVAKAGGFRLGRLLAIEEGGNFPLPYKRFDAALGMGGEGLAAPAAPRIEPGSQEIQVDVVLRYEID